MLGASQLFGLCGKEPILVKLFILMLSQTWLVCCLNFLYVETKPDSSALLVADAGEEFKGNLIVLQEKTSSCKIPTITTY